MNNFQTIINCPFFNIWNVSCFKLKHQVATLQSALKSSRKCFTYKNKHFQARSNWILFKIWNVSFLNWNINFLRYNHNSRPVVNVLIIKLKIFFISSEISRFIIEISSTCGPVEIHIIWRNFQLQQKDRVLLTRFSPLA